MYKTILVTLDATATDRAIIEHVKKLAKFMKSRVVLLHVATSAAAQWHGPNAAGEEVEEGQAYLNKVKAEFEAFGVPADTDTCLRFATGQANRQVGSRKRLRPCGHEHSRTPFAGRPVSRSNSL